MKPARPIRPSVRLWTRCLALGALVLGLETSGQPVFLNQPLPASARSGRLASFWTVVDSASPVAYQWLKDGTNLIGATGPTISFLAVQQYDAATYAVIASNASGSATSSPAPLTVLLSPEIYWPISTIPVGLGSTQSLGATVYGEPPFSYAWHKGTYSNSVLFSTNQYPVLANIQASDLGPYYFVVSNVHGSATSYVVNLIQWPPPPPPPPELPQITTQPVGGLFLTGARITNFVVVSNPQACSYQWQRNGGNLPGANAANYVVGPLHPALAGDYRVIVTNSAGSVTSAVARIELLTTPRITAHPESQTLVRGANLTLSVSAIGGSALSYSWRKNGAVLAGQTNATLAITNIQLSHAGTYRADVVNSYGSAASSNAIVTVLTPPLITGLSPSIDVPATTSALLYVSVDGQQPMTVRLWKDGAPYTGTNFLPDWIQIGGETSLTRRLNLLNAQPPDVGSYQFVITNVHGSITSAPVLITVGSAPIPPTITVQPLDVVVDLGGTATLTVAATGSAPLEYTWRPYLPPAPPSGGGPGNNPVATPPTFGPNATLTIPNVQLSHVGLYEVLVRNLGGTVASRVFALSVRQPLAVTSFPPSQLVNRGANLVLTAVVQGSFPVTYQWLKDGTNLPGTTNAQLRFFPSFQPRDVGDYRLVVRDALLGTTNSPIAKLRINPPPGMPGEVIESFAPTQPGGFVNAMLPEADGGLIVAGGFGFPWSGGGGGGTTSGSAGATTTTARGSGDMGNPPPVVFGSVNFITDVTYGGMVSNTFITPSPRPMLEAASTTPESLITNPVGIARLRADGSLDTSFLALASGVDGSIYALARQADGKILVGGYFATMNGSNVANLARLNADGSLDASFQPQPNASVRAIHVQPDQRIVIGGVFTSVAGTNRPYLARLHPDGALDAGFGSGGGPDNFVMALGALSDGRLMAGGHFRTFAGTPRALLARVNTDGSLDPAFDPGSGPALINGNRDLVVLPDGRCYVGGSVNGYQGRFSAVTRILANGALDPSFPVIEPLFLAFAAKPDGKVMVGGGFNQLTLGSANPREFFARSCLARFNADGTPDAAFDAGEFTSGGFHGLWALPSGDVIGSTTGTNPAGFASPLIRLRGHDAPPAPPEIHEQPVSQTVPQFTMTGFRVLATGSQPLRYQWRHNGTNLTMSGPSPPMFMFTSNITSAGIGFHAESRDQAGSFSVIVSNSAGAVTSADATLRVLVPQRFERPAPLPGGGVRLRFGDSYRPWGASVTPPLPPVFEVHASTNLFSTNWVRLTNALVSTNGEIILDDTDATNHVRRFYRVIER